MIEVSECGMQICEKADPNVELIFGTREPEEETEELRDFVQITIIAADFASKEAAASDNISSADTFGGAFGGQESFFNYAAPVAPAQPVNVAPASAAPVQPQSAPAQNTEDDDIPSFLKGRR
jgi:cell division GTPase FtsZ